MTEASTKTEAVTEVTVTEAPVPTKQSPFLPPDDLAPQARSDWYQKQGDVIWKAMVESIDYGKPKGFEKASKPTIYKPGVLKALRIAGVVWNFERMITEPDSEGHHRIQIIAHGTDKVTGEYRGSGFGAGSTRDRKYFRYIWADGQRTNDGEYQHGSVSLNTEVKLAEKRALADLAHDVCPGLSDHLTQDLEDMSNHPGASQPSQGGGGQSSRAPAPSGGRRGPAKQSAAATNVVPGEPPKPANDNQDEQAAFSAVQLYVKQLDAAEDAEAYAKVMLQVTTSPTIDGVPKYKTYIKNYATHIRKTKDLKNVVEAFNRLKAEKEKEAAAKVAEPPKAEAEEKAEEPAEKAAADDNGKGAPLTDRVPSMIEVVDESVREWYSEPQGEAKPIVVPVPAEGSPLEAWMEYGAMLLAYCEQGETVAGELHDDKEEIDGAELAKGFRQMLCQGNLAGTQAMMAITELNAEAMEVITNITRVPK